MGTMRKGHLGQMGSVHFARWLVPPGTRHFVFFSNYDGSWESYFEDFIIKAAQGVSAAWSSSKGFPETRFLLTRGAADGDRFKRFARRDADTPINRRTLRSRHRLIIQATLALLPGRRRNFRQGPYFLWTLLSKVWRRKSGTFFRNLLVKSCCNTLPSGRALICW